MNFVTTVKSFNAATKAPLDTAHWIVIARDQDEAQRISEQQVANANSTIPSVENVLVKVELFRYDLCPYLARNINCQGHQELEPLKQERGGNEH